MEVKFAPPSDPDDDYYLLNCFVCEEMAKPGQVPIGPMTFSIKDSMEENQA